MIKSGADKKKNSVPCYWEYFTWMKKKKEDNTKQNGEENVPKKNNSHDQLIECEGPGCLCVVFDAALWHFGWKHESFAM